jgi:hypothetical protein
VFCFLLSSTFQVLTGSKARREGFVFKAQFENLFEFRAYVKGKGAKIV